MDNIIEFTAQLIGDVGRRDAQIQRALHVLQQAQRYDLEPARLYQAEAMVSSDSGDWIAVDDVVKAIQILQEGQQ